MPADELLARLEAGKVYLPQQAERAAQNFFRKGNLIALRELALRRTADRVEDEVPGVPQRPRRSRRSGRPRRRCCAASARARAPSRSCAARRGWRGSSTCPGTRSTSRRRRCSASPTARRERILRALKLAAGAGRDHRDAAGADVPRGAGRLRARSTTCRKLVLGARPARASGGLAARRWRSGSAALAPDVDLIEVGAAAAPRRARRAARPAPTTRERRRRDRRGATSWPPPSCAATPLVATPLRAVLRAGQHRDAVPARGGRRGAALRARAGGAGGVPQRGGVRLLLRAAALLVRGQRRAVPAHLRA